MSRSKKIRNDLDDLKKRLAKKSAGIDNVNKMETSITHGDANDCPELPDLLERTAKRFTIDDGGTDIVLTTKYR